MRELIEKLIATNFADLEGLRVTGSVPVRESLINEAIQGILQEALKPKAAAEVPAAPVAPVAPKAAKSSPSIPKEAVLGMVKRAEVKLHEGQLVVEFDVQR